MTPLQWKIVDHAFHHQNDLFGLVPKTIRELYAAGPDSDVGMNDLMLESLGKQFGFIAWSSTKEKESHRRMIRSLRSNRNKHKRRRSAAGADYLRGEGRR